MSSVMVFRMLAQFLVIPILSRLLSPDDYGIVAIAMPFVLFTMMFSDVGIGQSLIRTSQQEEDVWSTSFWLTICLGVGLALLVAGAAPFAALFFGEPRLRPLVTALAFVMIPQAATTIPEAYLRKRHRFGVIAGTEAAAMAAGFIAAIVLAYKGGGAWALIAQQVAMYSARFVLTYFFGDFRPRLIFDLRRVADHLIFGRNVLGASFVLTLTQSLDGLIVGKILGPMFLGFYSMALMFVRLPARMVTGPLEYVIYVHLTRFGDDKPVIRQVFLLLTRILAILLFPAIGMVAAAHEPLFKLLLSEKWAESGRLFMLAAPAAALQAATGFTNSFMMALGRTKVQLRLNAEFCILMAAALLVLSWLGITWAVLGYSAAVFLYFPRFMALILPQLECSRAAYLRVLIVPAAITLACVLLYTDLTEILALGDWQRLFLGGGISLLGIGAGVLAQYRFLFGEAALLNKVEAEGTA